MTGLQPGRELHNALFSISTDTVHQVLLVLSLALASFMVVMYFSTWALPIIQVTLIVCMVVEFFSDLHKRNTWSDDE